MSNASDFTKLMNSTLSTITGMVGDVKAELDERIVSYLAKLNLVKREEHEVLQAMLKESRTEQENLKNRVLALENSIAKLKK